MNIKTRHRPWNPRSASQGTRTQPNGFYQTQLWKRTKAAFKRGRTLLRNGATGVMEWLSNMQCHTCFQETGRMVPMWAVDHKVQISEGGSRTEFANMQSQCVTCHASKSATEANAAKRKSK